MPRFERDDAAGVNEIALQVHSRGGDAAMAGLCGAVTVADFDGLV